jgi:chromosomal replication initiator protein
VRELEGALTRLMAYASVTGAAVSLATAQQVLRNIIASGKTRTIEVIRSVTASANLREQDLKVRSNTRHRLPRGWRVYRETVDDGFAA